MFSFRRGRRTARLLVGLGVLAAFPLFGSGVAQASMGGAPPATTNFRPDLRTVNVLTGINAGRAKFCFDKPIALTGTQTDFRLGGYRWDTILQGVQQVLDTNSNCADVLMAPNHNGDQADLNSYSFGTVLEGAATASISGGQSSLADSSPNLDSNSHNGTAGHTTGPDLSGVIIGSPAGTNEIIYSFDQPLDNNLANMDPRSFRYYNAAGVIQRGAAITGTDAFGDVRVAFNVPSVSDAVIAYVYHGGASGNGVNQQPVQCLPGPPPNGCTGGPGNGGGYSNNPNPETITPTLSVTVPGTSGVTALPDLVGATLVPGATNQIDYSFDQFVTLVDAGNFVAVTSNGDEIRAASATVLADGKTVRATFSGPNIGNYLEEIVVATAYDGAVKNSNNVLNAAQGKPAGDNAGAFATGFSNGPDATGVTFDATSGQVVVKFDQRVAANSAGQPIDTTTTGTPAVTLGHWHLLDNTGANIATPTSATVEHIGPYLDQVRLTFANPAIIGASKTLEICGNQNPSDTSNPSNPFVTFAGVSSSSNCPAGSAVYTFGDKHGTGTSGFNPAGNVQQLLAPTVSGAALRTGHTKITLRRVRITHASYLKHHKRHRHNRRHR